MRISTLKNILVLTHPLTLIVAAFSLVALFAVALVVIASLLTSVYLGVLTVLMKSVWDTYYDRPGRVIAYIRSLWVGLRGYVFDYIPRLGQVIEERLGGFLIPVAEVCTNYEAPEVPFAWRMDELDEVYAGLGLAPSVRHAVDNGPTPIIEQGSSIVEAIPIPQSLIEKANRSEHTYVDDPLGGKKHFSASRNERLDQAKDAVKGGMKVREAAKAFEVAESTLRTRIKRGLVK